jgi:hypothetical protein
MNPPTTMDLPTSLGTAKHSHQESGEIKLPAVVLIDSILKCHALFFIKVNHSSYEQIKAKS